MTEQKATREYTRFWVYALKHYGPRLSAVLEKIRDHLQANGWDCDPIVDLTTEDLEFCLTVSKPPEDVDELAVDFRVSMCLQEDHADGKGGVTFRLDVSRVGGNLIGNVAPENYGPQCWVKRRDKQAVSERLAILENLDPAMALRSIERKSAHGSNARHAGEAPG